MKQVIMWSSIFIVLFIVFIGLAFVGLTYMTPSPDEIKQIKLEQKKVHTTPEIADSDSTKTKGKKITIADSLQIIIDQQIGDLFFMRVTIDSLNEQLGSKEDLVTEFQTQVKSLNDNIQTLKTNNISIKDLAKTYETMKVAEIRPILEKVSDATIIALYKNMGSRTRKNLIQALSSSRAAQITTKLAESSS